MFGIHVLWPDVSTAVLLLVSGAGFVAFYFVGRWIAIRTELNKKLSIVQQLHVQMSKAIETLLRVRWPDCTRETKHPRPSPDCAC
jgi:hypothetical protein